MKRKYIVSTWHYETVLYEGEDFFEAMRIFMEQNEAVISCETIY